MIAAAATIDYTETCVHITRKSPVAIVGAGLSGLLLARRTVCDGHPVTVLEKGKAVGGVWHLQANAQSKVNTTEAAYRVAERGVVINFDHPLTFQIMNDLQFISTIYLTQ